MKAKRLFLTTLATAMMAVSAAENPSPVVPLQGEESLLSASIDSLPPSSGMTVNDQPATPAQKAVARKLTQQGVRMARKGMQMAVTAVTHPDKAERMGDELEHMGDEMERLGDSLESLAEDTTFFYEGEDSDAVVVDDEGWDDVAQEIRKEFGQDTWWGRLIGGGLGLFGGFLGVVVAFLVVVLLVVLLTSPIWVVALIVWLIVKGTRTHKTTTYVNPPLNASAASAAPTAAPSAHVQPYPDENAEMWKSGIMWSCIGVGLILVFLGIGLDGLWGIGGLVACIGVAKLVIATSAGKKGGASVRHDGHESLHSYTDEHGTADSIPRSAGYDKSEK